MRATVAWIQKQSLNLVIWRKWLKTILSWDKFVKSSFNIMSFSFLSRRFDDRYYRMLYQISLKTKQKLFYIVHCSQWSTARRPLCCRIGQNNIAKQRPQWWYSWWIFVDDELILVSVLWPLFPLENGWLSLSTGPCTVCLLLYTRPAEKRESQLITKIACRPIFEENWGKFFAKSEQ